MVYLLMLEKHPLQHLRIDHDSLVAVVWRTGLFLQDFDFP